MNGKEIKKQNKIFIEQERKKKKNKIVASYGRLDYFTTYVHHIDIIKCFTA